MKQTICLMICVLMVAMSWPGKLQAYQASEIDETYSFENDFEGWTIRSNQAEPSLPPPVIQTQERATDGVTSLKLTVNRLSIFQVVWVEKAFDAKPNQVYDATIDYSFGTRDCCHSNPSGIAAGILNKSPGSTGRDLAAASQGEADNGESKLSDYKWLNKHYTFTTRTNEQGKLYAVIGIGGGESTRSYFIDKLRINIIERAEPCEFYSFENDFDGWTSRALDFDAESNPPSWSVQPSGFVFQEGQTSLEFTINSPTRKPKVWIEKAFQVTPKKKYRVKVEYSFFSQDDVPNSKIFAGAMQGSPQITEDLEPFYQESVDAYDRVWRRYQYEFVGKAKKSGLIYVVIGMVAKEQKFQAFNFDNVCVTVVRK